MNTRKKSVFKFMSCLILISSIAMISGCKVLTNPVATLPKEPPAYLPYPLPKDPTATNATSVVASPQAQQIYSTVKTLGSVLPPPIGSTVDMLAELGAVGLMFWLRRKNKQIAETQDNLDMAESAADTHAKVNTAMISAIESLPLTVTKEQIKTAIQSAAVAAGVQDHLDNTVQIISKDIPGK